MTDTDTTSTPALAAPAVDLGAFSKMIGDAVAQGITAANPRKKSFGQYDKERKEKARKAGRQELTRQCYQNGILLSEESLTNKEIECFNAIDRTGRYLDRFVEVIVRDLGSEEVVELRYPDKTNDHRNKFMRLAGTLEHALELVVKAQKAEGELDGDIETRAIQRRHFGDSKASKEARARAAVIA